MEHNKIIAYSLLAHINNNGQLIKDLFDVFKPLVKRILAQMSEEGITQGKSILEIKNRVDDQYKLDIPIPVLGIILKRIADEINKEGIGEFSIYKDNAFVIKNYVFVEFEELIEDKEKEIDKLEQLFISFCKIHNINPNNQYGIFEFIDSNKMTIAKYLSFKGKRKKEDFTTEALFVEYFRQFKDVFNLIKDIYLGSIISSYVEYQTNPVNRQIELLFDTNFIVSLLDLKTVESTHTCNKLIEIAKTLGYRLNVLNITLLETRNLLEKKGKNFDKAFLEKKIDPEDIYNACDRRKLNKTDLERIADNLEENLNKIGINVIPNTEKYQNIARYSNEYKMFKSIRNNDFAALHDATVIYYVREKRGNKKIRNFDKVNCWFVNNTSSWKSSDSLISNKGENGHQPETIRAEDFINILWLSNPNIKQQVKDNEIAEIGITRMISCTLNETLPKNAIIRELDDNIKKYANEKISDKDVLRIATRIANRSFKNIEELNKIADNNSEEFIKRLQKEADIERNENEKRLKEFQNVIQKFVQKEKEMNEISEEYKNKIHEVKATKLQIHEKDFQINEEKKKRLKAENDLIKIKRDKYIKDRLNSWRKRSWIELITCLILTSGLFIVVFYKSEWNIEKVIDLIIDLQQNFIYSLLIGLIGIVFSSVVFTNLVSKYRNQSNIKAFIDNIEKFELPEELKDKKE